MLSKKKFLLIVWLLLVLVLTAEVVVNAEQEIALQTPPTMAALPMLWIYENDLLGEEIQLDITISPDINRAISLISKGDVDLMVTGVNVGAKIFNKGIDVKLMNTSIWAIDYLLTRDFKANEWGDLKGKTLALPLKGGPLDFLARYFLQENGVKPEEVKLVYKPLTNGARSFQLGQLDSIILPEPLLTITMSKGEDIYLSFDLNEEWAKLHDGEGRIPYVGLFVNGKMAREQPVLLKKLNKLYHQGVEWVNSHPDEAAALASKYFGMPAKIIKASFQRINLNCYPEGESFRLTEIYFNEILQIYPEMIGGRLPNENFYF